MREVMKAWTRVSASGRDNIGRILARLRRWKKADLVMFLMWGIKDRPESKMTPKFLTVCFGFIGQPSRFMVVFLNRLVCLAGPISSISDFAEFRSRKFVFIHDFTSVKQVSRLWIFD